MSAAMGFFSLLLFFLGEFLFLEANRRSTFSHSTRMRDCLVLDLYVLIDTACTVVTLVPTNDRRNGWPSIEIKYGK